MYKTCLILCNLVYFSLVYPYFVDVYKYRRSKYNIYFLYMQSTLSIQFLHQIFNKFQYLYYTIQVGDFLQKLRYIMEYENKMLDILSYKVVSFFVCKISLATKPILFFIMQKLHRSPGMV